MKHTKQQLEQDESLWPDGATHYEYNYWIFYKEINGKVYCLIDGVWKKSAHNSISEIIGSALVRPTKYTWVPELGVECEYSVDGRNWYVCKVIVFSAHAAFIKSHKANIHNCKEYSIELNRVQFRPIKSERDLFVAKAFKVFGEASGNGLIALYEAGCRFIEDSDV